MLLTTHSLLVLWSWKSRASYTSTHPLGHTGRVMGSLYLFYSSSSSSNKRRRSVGGGHVSAGNGDNSSNSDGVGSNKINNN